MNKFTKRLLTGLAALGLLAPLMGNFTNVKAAHYSYNLNNKLVMRAINHGHVYGPTKRFFIRYKGFTFRCGPRYSHHRLQPGGVIEAVNGNYRASNRQVIAALQGRRINGYRSARRRVRRGKATTYRTRRARHYYLRFHGKIVGWAFNYRTYKKDQAYINTLGTPYRKHRASRRTRRYYLRFHGKIVGWALNYHTYKKDQAYINTLGTPRRKRKRRTVRRHRTHYYHIYMDGYDDGWTNSYRVYKQRLGQLKKSIAASRAQSNDAQVTPATGSSQDQTSSDDQDQGSQKQTVIMNPDEPSDNQQATNDQHSNDVNTNIAEMKQQTLVDINNDRAANGLYPLTESSKLDNIAAMRSAQCQHIMAHIDPSTGRYFSSEDAYKLGYVNDPAGYYYGENQGEAGIGHGKLNDGTWIYDRNGYDMANTEEDEMMNHDASSNNGHRNNILWNGLHYVGIGVNYDTQNPNDIYPYKLTEDFSY